MFSRDGGCFDNIEAVVVFVFDSYIFLSRDGAKSVGGIVVFADLIDGL